MNEENDMKEEKTMSIQDRLERIFKEMHIMLSRGPVLKEDERYVIVHKKDMIHQLNLLSQTVSEMMEIYEATERSRAKGERKAQKYKEKMIDDAGKQAEDIYAASVLYTDDALGRIQDIIGEAQQASEKILSHMLEELEDEQKQIRLNQIELKSQLEDLKDTSKYIRLIEERNKQIAKERAKRRGEYIEEQKSDTANSDYEEELLEEIAHESEEDETEFTPVQLDIRINEEYFEKNGLQADMADSLEEEVTYEKPEIIVNTNAAYFKQKEQEENKEDDIVLPEISMDLDEPILEPETEQLEENGKEKKSFFQNLIKH